MANKTISDLRELSTVSNSNVLVVETNADTFKVTKDNLLKEGKEEGKAVLYPRNLKRALKSVLF